MELKMEVEPETEKKQRRTRKPKQETENVETSQKPKIFKRKRGEAWDENLESYLQGEKSNIISTWVAHNRKLYKIGKLPNEKLEKLVAVNFPFEVVKKK
jgi:hypothetical protein